MRFPGHAPESWHEVSHTLAKPDHDRRSSHDTGTGETGTKLWFSKPQTPDASVASGSEKKEQPTWQLRSRVRP
jgi:hypothetical protein